MASNEHTTVIKLYAHLFTILTNKRKLLVIDKSLQLKRLASRARMVLIVDGLIEVQQIYLNHSQLTANEEPNVYSSKLCIE